jgi:hypothetical protein
MIGLPGKAEDPSCCKFLNNKSWQHPFFSDWFPDYFSINANIVNRICSDPDVKSCGVYPAEFS